MTIFGLGQIFLRDKWQTFEVHNSHMIVTWVDLDQLESGWRSADQSEHCCVLWLFSCSQRFRSLLLALAQIRMDRATVTHWHHISAPVVLSDSLPVHSLISYIAWTQMFLTILSLWFVVKLNLNPMRDAGIEAILNAAAVHQNLKFLSLEVSQLLFCHRKQNHLLTLTQNC